jgi:hypothetical protein
MSLFLMIYEPNKIISKKLDVNIIHKKPLHLCAYWFLNTENTNREKETKHTDAETRQFLWSG